jgi:glucan phosphoethanolaminetransferase (alkaline phosphatase superfamily)
MHSVKHLERLEKFYWILSVFIVGIIIAIWLMPDRDTVPRIVATISSVCLLAMTIFMAKASRLEIKKGLSNHKKSV